MFMLIKYIYYLLLIILFSFAKSNNHSHKGAFSIARIHYGGGGDWYSDRSSIPNLLEFVSQNTNVITNLEQEIVKIGENKYVVASLRDSSLNFFQLNKENKIEELTRVEVFRRVRDMIYLEDTLYLFLEDSPSIGILKIN